MDPFKMCHCGGIVGCAVGESQSEHREDFELLDFGYALENQAFRLPAGIADFAKYAARVG